MDRTIEIVGMDIKATINCMLFMGTHLKYKDMGKWNM